MKYSHLYVSNIHVQKGKNCVGIDLDRSMKTFGFKNLGLDRLIGDNKKFC